MVLYRPIKYPAIPDLEMTPWTGRNIVFLTPLDIRDSLDPAVMTDLVERYDRAYEFYAHVTGREPIPLDPFTIEGRGTIAVVPFSCGAGCGFPGRTGIELWQDPYFTDFTYQRLVDEGTYNQIVFFEFGRNFWFYGDQLGGRPAFFGGFAAANQFLAMEAAGVRGDFLGSADQFEIVKKAVLQDVARLYFADDSLNWANTIWQDAAPTPPEFTTGVADLGASLMYRIYEDFGLEAYRAFWHEIGNSPYASSDQDVLDNFLEAANAATGIDYGFFTKGPGFAYTVGEDGADVLRLSEPEPGEKSVALGFGDDDKIIGSSAAEMIFGGAGDDLLIGGSPPQNPQLRILGTEFEAASAGDPLDEPNDTISEATDSGITFARPGEFLSAGLIGDNPNVDPEQDVDLFLVELEAGDQLTIDVDADELGSGLDSILRLFDSAGNELDVSDDDPAPGEPFSYDPYIEFTASHTGAYYVGVSGYDNFDYNPFVEGSGVGFYVGEYDIAITSFRVDDVLVGGVGNDELLGGGGDDVLVGGDGRDLLDGGSGNDKLYAGDDKDRLVGGSGDDELRAGLGNDKLDGGHGDDLLFGEGDDDRMFGRSGNDELSGGEGQDLLDGGPGDDELRGNAGDDELLGDAGRDRLFGGPGDDLLRGEAGDDVLRGGAGDDVVIGGDGDDLLRGRAGDDILKGGSGNDDIRGGAGDDELRGNSGCDTFEWNLYEDQGTDLVISFQESQDKLRFTDLLDVGGAPGPDLSDLDAITTFEDGGPSGPVTASLDSGTVIVIAGAGTGAVDSWSDLVDNPSEQLIFA